MKTDRMAPTTRKTMTTSISPAHRGRIRRQSTEASGCRVATATAEAGAVGSPCLPTGDSGRHCGTAAQLRRQRQQPHAEAARPRGYTLRQRDSLFRKLCAQLRSIRREYRQALLERGLSQRQRLALERWMLLCREQRPSEAEAMAVLGKRCHKSGPGADDTPRAKEQGALEAPPSKRRRRLTGSTVTALARRACKARSRLNSKSRALQSAKPCRSSAVKPAMPAREHQVRGLLPRATPCEAALAKVAPPASPAQSPSHYALVYVGALRLSSGKSLDRALALRRLEALDAVRHHEALGSANGDSVARGTEAASLDEALPVALAEVLPRYGLTLATLGLRVSVRLSVRRWLQEPLSSPTFTATSNEGLAEGLRAWRRLHETHAALVAVADPSKVRCSWPPSADEEAAWQRLRDMLLDIEAEAGLDRMARSKRLASAEWEHRLRHARAFERRWSRRAAREERKQAKVRAKEARTVEAARCILAELAALEARAPALFGAAR